MRTPLDLNDWPVTPDEIQQWYESGENWMASHGKRRLSALGHRLWEVASARDTIEYLPLASEFDLPHHGNYNVGWWSGLVSDYCWKVMGHVYLSAVLVTKESKSPEHPKGVPARGYYSEESRTPEQKKREVLDEQKEVWDYCSTHPNPFHP
jgi:hypothetical protein